MPVEKLSLEHRPLLDQRLKGAHTFLSEFSFANLYLFRQTHDYRVVTEGGAVFVTGQTTDGRRCVMPTEDVRVSGLDALLRVLTPQDIVFPVPEEWLSAFPGTMFEQTLWEGDSDYLYKVERIATYQGQQLQKRRNLLHQFLALYVPRPEPLTPERVADAQAVLEGWQSDVGEPLEATDHAACREALARAEELALCGMIYYVEEEPAGFLIGEELNGRMYALHFAKGRRKFKGLYQYMFNHFAGMLPGKYEYLNFEQDMGKLALKIAKSSYYPDRMLDKYRLSLRSSP